MRRLLDIFWPVIDSNMCCKALVIFRPVIFGAPRDCTNWQPETRLKQLGAESDHFNVSPTPLHEESFDSVFLSLAALGTMRGKPPLFQPSLASQNFPLNLEFGEPKLSHHPPLQGYKYQRDLRSLSDFL